jgi:hypothetical protein
MSIIYCLVVGWLFGYLSALFMLNRKDKLEHLEQNKCPHGHIDWDDCPGCGH